VSIPAPGAGVVAHEPEDPRVLARNLSVGTRLFVSATAFVFMAFVFAFFYLKAVNSNGDWHPPHTNPTQAYGIASLVCVLATAVFVELGRRVLRAGTGRTWAAFVGVALAFAVAATALQVLQILATKFSAYVGGGYSSVFYGWIVMFLLFWLGAVYWVETLLATGLRGLRPPDHPYAEPVELLRPSADACAVYLYLTVGIAILAYVLLYLIK
jgi:heme/copper-type cytochrome/quinol oxidase subunit 3